METIRIHYSICAHYHADVHCLHCSSEFGVAGCKYSREIQEHSRTREIRAHIKLYKCHCIKLLRIKPNGVYFKAHTLIHKLPRGFRGKSH